MAEKKVSLKLLITIHQLLFFACANGSVNSSAFDIDKWEKNIAIGTKIIGGSATDIRVYPFIISIQWRYTSRLHCGGSYITHGVVLTAAHCLVRDQGYYWITESPWLFNVVAGSTTLSFSPTWQISGVEKVIPHPHFNRAMMSHDIGLLRLSAPFRITPYVSYAPIPSSPVEFLEERGLLCQVVGWGQTNAFDHKSSSSLLSHAEVPLIPTLECNVYFTHRLHVSQICAGYEEGGIDACRGDSGGPFICNGTQVGIVSWGHGCAIAHSPGVYCRVDFYLNWINDTILNIDKSKSTSVLSNQQYQFNLLLIVLTIYLHCSNCFN